MGGGGFSYYINPPLYGGSPFHTPYITPLPSGGVLTERGGVMFSINFPGNFKV